MKRSLQQIQDFYINLGFRNEKLREALDKDVQFQQLLAEKKEQLTSTFPVTAAEQKKYLLVTDTDYLILSLCKKLEHQKLTEEDKLLVRLIKSQLEHDWRKELVKFLNTLYQKYVT